MRLVELSPGAYADLVRSPYVDDHVGDMSEPTAWLLSGDLDPDLPQPGALPVAVLWLGSALGAEGPLAADAVVGDSDIDGVLERIACAPRSAATLAVLMRSQGDRDVEAGLAAESAAYSVLQSGPEFASWRSGRCRRLDDAETSAIVVERVHDTLTITLDRPHRRNAINAQMRDELSAALALAVIDQSIERLQLRGNGPSFSAGGDLDEFGSFADPATAHATRLARSPARLVHRLSERIAVHVHGTTLGGGIELAAFAGCVTAAPDTKLGLPEIELGLIPGAGGTVSMTRRIGRQRTTAMALSGARIDVDTAVAWGLIDRIIP